MLRAHKRMHGLLHEMCHGYAASACGMHARQGHACEICLAPHAPTVADATSCGSARAPDPTARKRSVIAPGTAAAQ
jgi:hypothetical protein